MENHCRGVRGSGWWKQPVLVLVAAAQILVWGCQTRGSRSRSVRAHSPGAGGLQPGTAGTLASTSPCDTVCHKPSHLCVCIPDGFCVSTFLLIRIRIPVRWGSLWPPQLELHLDVIASLQALCPCTGLGLGLQQRNVREAQFSPKQIYTFVNIRGTVYLNCIHFIRCKLYLNKVGIF